MLGKAHRHIYVITLILLAISIPISKSLPNVLGGVLVGNWFLEWNWREKWERIKANKLALILGGMFFCFCYAFIGRHDGVAASDWLSKTPFLYFPIILATTKAPEIRWQRFVLLAFSITTAVAAALCVIIMHVQGIVDVREGGLFVSHIRFSICAVLSILFCLHFVLQHHGYRATVQLGCLLIAVWLLAFLFYIQVGTGILLLAICGIVSFCKYLFSTKKTSARKITLAVGGVFIAILAVCFSIITYQYFHYDENIEKNLPVKTKHGHLYTHYPSDMPEAQLIENGNKLGNYLCQEEMTEAWPKKSQLPYDSVRKTLIRYLNSKGLSKDANGVAALDDDDIQNVEAGVANVYYLQQFGLKRLLYPTYFTISLYELEGTVQNSSLLQRVEVWKASYNAFCNNPLIGYGMGGNKPAIDKVLDQKDSPISRNMGSHNQFLTYALMGGIPLFLCFLVFLAAPFFDKKRKKTFLYLLFFICMVVSMLFEDTLETSTGINLCLFFNAFFLFTANPEEV